MTLTILSENSPHPEDPELKAEHGLAVHISIAGKSILYDFGPQGTLIQNSLKLGVDLKAVESAVLSHGHYDHSGDMEVFLRTNSKAVVYHGRDAFRTRWSIAKGSPREVGIPMVSTEEFEDRLTTVSDLDDRGDFVILPAATGHMPKPAGNALLLVGAEGERLQDDFVDELTLVIRLESGLVVLTGCSHRGVLNIVDQVQAYCPSSPINALIGGFHLLDNDETEESLRQIGSRLAADLPGSRIYSGHCTEKMAGEILASSFGSRYENLYAGMVIEF